MEQLLGQLQLFAFGYAPQDGWMLCNGQILQIAQNQALFALLGANFGGNGTTTFAVPNLNQAVLSASPYAQWYIATTGYFPSRN